jgi:hypothetical protein
MVPLGLVAEQVIDEEVPRDAVELAVKVERALPPPDVKMSIRPDARAPGKLSSQGLEYDPLAASLVANRQLPRGNQQVAPNLDHQSRADCRDQEQGRAQRRGKRSCSSSRRPAGPPRQTAQHGQAIGQCRRNDQSDARGRQEVVVLPVEAGKDNLQTRGNRPCGNQAAARGGAGPDQQKKRCGNRRQPERPASRPPPHEIRC